MIAGEKITCFAVLLSGAFTYDVWKQGKWMTWRAEKPTHYDVWHLGADIIIYNLKFKIYKVQSYKTTQQSVFLKYLYLSRKTA